LRGYLDSWVQAQCEMLHRLTADRAEIERRFGLDAGRIVSLELDLSDRHSGGRTVASFAFESGLKLIYKPRQLGIEAWFAELQRRLNTLGAPLPFRPLEVVSRESYGWTEFAVHRHCQDKKQLQRFYRKAGALLCLLHLLRATDCHFENLIACGEDPLFVDAETLFQPTIAANEGISVLRTGMLPRLAPMLMSAGSPVVADMGALSCVSAQTVPIPLPAMNGSPARTEMVVMEPETNLPFSPNQERTPQAYVEEMTDGFRQTWQFLAEHKEPVKTVLEGAHLQRIRYVFRDTLSYYQAMVAALSLGNLDGVVLPPLPSSKTAFAPLEAAELAALRELDIPRFTLGAAESGLHGIGGCFARTGFDLVRDAVENLTAQAMDAQIAVIRLSWGLYGMAKQAAVQA
jgi:type 2 lantibiotic biosynthesis protein LanM